MVDEDTKKRAKLAFIEGLEELCSQIDKDYQEIIKSKSSLEHILEKVKKCRLNHEAKMNSLENDLFIPYKLTDIDISRVRQQTLFFSSSSRGIINIIFALNKISNSNCRECKKNLSKDNCYLYFFETKNIVKWTIEKALNFNSESFHNLFCSPSCFKNSIYYPKQTNREKAEPVQSQASQEQEENTLCSGLGCLNEIPFNSTYYYSKSQPNNKFCSKECFVDYYGEYCKKCANKFPELYYWDKEKYPNLIYCSNCYDKESKKTQEVIEKENQTVYCQYCSVEISKQKFFPVCDKDECKKKFWGIKDELVEVDRRTEEQKNRRTEEQKNRRTEEQKNRETLESPSSPNNNLNSQINSLESEIKVLESNPTNQNLLNAKKAELEELKKQQNTQIQPNTNSKLYLGIGLGILGGGIIGLVLWLVLRKRRIKE